MPAPKAQNAPTLDVATLRGLGRTLCGLYAEPREQPVSEHLLDILRRAEIARRDREEDVGGAWSLKHTRPTSRRNDEPPAP
jgi:hypothetical protein